MADERLRRISELSEVSANYIIDAILRQWSDLDLLMIVQESKLTDGEVRSWSTREKSGST